MLLLVTGSPPSIKATSRTSSFSLSLTRCENSCSCSALPSPTVNSSTQSFSVPPCQPVRKSPALTPSTRLPDRFLYCNFTLGCSGVTPLSFVKATVLKRSIEGLETGPSTCTTLASHPCTGVSRSLVSYLKSNVWEDSCVENSTPAPSRPVNL